MNHASTSSAVDERELSSADAERLTSFTRACKTALHAVALYPDGHPAAAASLGRLADVTSCRRLAAPLRLRVLADRLLIENRTSARVDRATVELAALLHSHMVGELTVHEGGDAVAWRLFLELLVRTPESVRANGGIASVWRLRGSRHVEIREIDYADVLRERTGRGNASWEQIVVNCLRSNLFSEDESIVRELIEVARATSSAGDTTEEASRPGESSREPAANDASTLVRFLRTIVDRVAERDPSQLDSVMRDIAGAVGHLSPSMILALLARVNNQTQFADQLARHVSDETMTSFIVRNVWAGSTPLDRVAQAFQALVRDSDRREWLVAQAHDEMLASAPEPEGFEERWTDVAARLLDSYSDEAFVCELYAQELSGVRTRALELDQVADDPPDRKAIWLGSITPGELRTLDVQLLSDLLRIEDADEQWAALMPAVSALLFDLFFVGDFRAARKLVEPLVRERGSAERAPRREAAANALNTLVSGPVVQHIATQLATIDDEELDSLRTMCLSLGESLICPLAEALARAHQPLVRNRLKAILMAYGAIGQRQIEHLKSSPDAAVRQTAIYLLRELGGHKALPDLTELLGDTAPEVQREAIRAILDIGTDRAYRVLEQALVTGRVHSRHALTEALASVRDERATPLYLYILQHVNPRGPLAPICLRAIEGLGAVRDPRGVPSLKEALYRSTWWAPRRSAAFRRAAAAALARIGSADAWDILQEASRSWSLGVRAAARAHAEGVRAPVMARTHR